MDHSSLAIAFVGVLAMLIILSAALFVILGGLIDLLPDGNKARKAFIYTQVCLVASCGMGFIHAVKLLFFT